MAFVSAFCNMTALLSVLFVTKPQNQKLSTTYNMVNDYKITKLMYLITHSNILPPLTKRHLQYALVKVTKWSLQRAISPHHLCSAADTNGSNFMN